MDNSAASPPWADLPSDAVSEIAGRLHEPGDFVRFHAVCRPWRKAPPPPHQTPGSFLPCLLEHTIFDYTDNLSLYSPFSRKRTGLHTRTSILAGKKLKGSDAAGGRFLAIAVNRQPVLVNPLTGAVTALPPLSKDMFPSYTYRWQCSKDGVVMFYSSWSRAVVLLRPGENCWQEIDVEASLDNMGLNSAQDLDQHTRRAIALLCSSGGVPTLTRAMAQLPRAAPGTSRYVLESLHGELLLCLDVLDLQKAKSPDLISVTVHALEVRNNDGTPQWVKQGRGGGIDDGHACLFLSKDGSGFAIDVREFGGADEVTGGCAYFVDNHPTQTMRDAVWRYNFRDGTATVVDELPAGFGITCMWYKPRRPIISALSSRPNNKRGNDGSSQSPVRSRPRLQPLVHSQCAQ
ncbi:hypothetical protein QOZ80_8BG0667150 [Eleusine coracana subsp. coracana]|nr:hypothetical protein QOZ80_8BG0667150 [Eleusine coracana subsp. coracana]